MNILCYMASADCKVVCTVSYFIINFILDLTVLLYSDIKVCLMIILKNKNIQFKIDWFVLLNVSLGNTKISTSITIFSAL